MSPPAASPLFDAYLMVDWSARSGPARGADSIWWALVERRNGAAALIRRENPPLRAAAVERIAEVLAALSAEGRRSLIGFDFPFGYPAGFAAALGLDGAPPWTALWRLLCERVEDAPDNRNNRFEVAAALNGMTRFGAFPFWGHPPGRHYPRLGAKKPRCYGPDTLPERRLIEHRVRRAKPVWQLSGSGAVGGQALLGIPCVRALRRDPRLADRARVWPFETGLAPPRPASGEIVIAEVYPSIIKENQEPDLVKDARQVRTIAEHFAGLDDAGALAPLFAGDPGLTAAERRLVETEEAWILGVA
jgi:precorrin-8X/cobalt-precorrin-8 methylmutase